MEISKFLNDNGFRWAYIVLAEGQPPRYYRTGESYSFKDFSENSRWAGNQLLLDADRLKIFNQYKKMDKYRETNQKKYLKARNNGVYIAYQSDNYSIIDVDNMKLFENSYNFLKTKFENTHQYLSRGKRYPHYIVNMNVDSCRLIFRDNAGNNVGDILNGQSPWVRINEMVHGNEFTNADIKDFVTDYKPTKKTKSTFKLISSDSVNFNIKEVNELLGIIDERYWDDFQTWINIGLSLKGLYGEAGFSLWDSYSMNSPKYDEDDIGDRWEKMKVNDEKVSPRTIARLAMSSDVELYYKWVIKYGKGYKYMLHNKKPFSKTFLKFLIKICEEKFIYNNQFTEEEKTDKKNKKYIMEKYFNKNNEILMSYVGQYICYVDSSTTIIIKHNYDDSGNMINGLLYKSEKDIAKSLSDCMISNKSISKKLISVVSLWEQYKHKRVFDKFVYEPGKYYEYKRGEYNKFNSWYGWEYKYDPHFKVNTNILQPILLHLKDVICDGNMELYSYILRIQKLILMGIKPEIALLVHGKKGTGKSIYFEWFGKYIIGKTAYSYVNNIGQLTARFNSYITSKSFSVCDELAVWDKTGNTANYEMMKSLITQKQIPFERKGQEAILMDDFNYFVMISNNFNAYPMGDKDNRRIVAMSVNESKKGDMNYFQKLDECMKNKDVCKNYFQFIMDLDMNGFNRRIIPKTKYRDELIARATPYPLNFLAVLLFKCVSTKKNMQMSNKEIYELYESWCEEHNIYPEDNVSLFKKWNYVDGVTSCKHRTATSRGYRFNVNVAEKIYNILNDKYEIDRKYYLDGDEPQEEPYKNNIIYPVSDNDPDSDSDSDSNSGFSDSDDESII